MDDIDLTQGLCGWNQNQMENDEISLEMELWNMFNQLKIVNQVKRPRIHTQRPKSSTVHTKRRPVEQNISKTARILPKQARTKLIAGSTSKNRSSACPKSSHSKTSNKALMKAYLSRSYSRKKLKRSHSNLYIRDTNKNITKPHNHSKHNKKPKANSLDLKLNLDAITNVSEPVAFSEILFRKKYEETLDEINSNKNNNSKSKPKRKLKHRSELSTDELSLQYSQKSEILKNVDDHYKKQLIKNTPFLTPSASMISLHEHKSTKSATKSKQTVSKPKPNFAKPKKRNSSRSVRPKTTHRNLKSTLKTANAIPIKCFNSNVFATPNVNANTGKQGRVFVNLTGRKKDIKNIRSKSVDMSDNKETDGVSDIVRHHRKKIRGKENMTYDMRGRKYEEDDEHKSLEQKLRNVIARWESHEKMKATKSSRSRRVPVFQ